MPTLLTAGDGTNGVVITSASDNALTIQTGAAGAKVNAVAFASDGTATLLKGPQSTDSGSSLGYGTGAGGTVTQATSRATAVTINRPTGSITMFSAAGSTSWSGFVVNNSVVSANDSIILGVRGGNSNFYTLQVGAVSNGNFQINFVANGTATDAPVINFAVIKGATT